MRKGLVASLSAIAAVCMTLSLMRAWLHVSMAWDVWYYHMPFAARLAGLVPATDVTFDTLGEIRYRSFPILAELAQGLLWKIFGRPEAANLLSGFSLLALALGVSRLTKTPLLLFVLAWLAIPVVQIHACIAYVDLPANAAVAMLVFIVHRAWTKSVSGKWIAVAIAASIFAANAKLQLAPILAVFLLALAIRFLRDRKVIALIAATPLVFFTQISNLVRYGNPAYPVEVHVLGRTLPFAETPYDEISDRFRPLAQPLRFGASVLEMGLYPFGDSRRYTVDQWTPLSVDGCRLGGFLNVYVIAMLVLFVILAWRHREGRRALGVFAMLTAITCILPASHVLRYYLAWMLVLTGFVIMFGYRELRRVRGKIAITVPAFALVLTTTATQGLWLTPEPFSFPDLLAIRAKKVEEIPEGGRACITDQPWAFLYAARFHGRHYTIATVDRVEDCPWW